MIEAREVRMSGRVQGVGFRPFVYRTAVNLDLVGTVKNAKGIVVIQLQGTVASLIQFEKDVLLQAPPLSEPEIVSSEVIARFDATDFQITRSSSSGKADIHIPPDFFVCDDCLEELMNENERRFSYPFINCTQCGPRYSIIQSLPYDRPNTTMADFALCEDCASEYNDPLDRRFHAQPLACATCGPELEYVSEQESYHGDEESLQAAIDAINAGKVVAIKGVGGYHLACDACDNDAVLTLRKRKNRPDKPLAVMFPMGEQSLDDVLKFTSPSEEEKKRIVHPSRPIVLVALKPGTELAQSISPGLTEVGVFLPYSPFYHLLLKKLQRPLVLTSGNLSGEPVLTQNDEAATRLSRIADGFVHHNRKIERPVDDSVLRVINGEARMIRMGRGFAPTELALPGRLDQPVLAVGGQMKVTIALAWESRCVISPHIGELHTPRGQEVFQKLVTDLQALYQVEAKRILCDAHPGYNSHRWAKKQSLPVREIYHHDAHASGVAGEFSNCDKLLCFTWDGTGYGKDGNLWGGEALLRNANEWQRVASFRPFKLPGGEKAGRQPWRSAAALCWETNKAWHTSKIKDIGLAFEAWSKHINAPSSSAVGRLFDAAAYLVNRVSHVSYEGQGPMQLEALCDPAMKEAIELPLSKNQEGILIADWSGLIEVMSDDGLAKNKRATIFHNSLAKSLVDQAIAIRDEYEFDAIGLTGGVFQNRFLVERICGIADTVGLTVLMPSKVPVNDGGISYGQVIEYLLCKKKNT